MTKIVATIDVDKITVPFDELQKIIGEFSYYIEPEEWSNHIRDMTKGWTKVSSIKDWNSNLGPFEPGTYAIVVNKTGLVDHPILCNCTVIIGETTQEGWRRLQHQVGALRGAITNTSDKWQRAIPEINRQYSFNIEKNLDLVDIWFRPHAVTDKDHKYNRRHSSHMETQAHAQYHALWGHGTVANTRDLPSTQLINESKKFLTKRGYKVYESNKDLSY